MCSEVGHCILKVLLFVVYDGSVGHAAWSPDSATADMTQSPQIPGARGNRGADRR